MAAIINFDTASRCPSTTNAPGSEAATRRPALRLIEGGRSRHVRHMRRVYFVRRSAALCAVLLALVLAGTLVGSLSGAITGTGTSAVGAAEMAQVYTVRQGDTLWSIVSSAAPKSDPRDVIDTVEELNSTSTTRFSADAPLQAGQRLLLPGQ